MAELMTVHKTLSQCTCLLTFWRLSVPWWGSLWCLFASTALISHPLYTPRCRAGGLEALSVRLLAPQQSVRACKERGGQVYPSSILFENSANEAQLNKMKIFIVWKFPTFFPATKLNTFPPALPIKFLQNGKSAILAALITNCCSRKEDQFGYTTLRWTCKTI